MTLYHHDSIELKSIIKHYQLTKSSELNQLIQEKSDSHSVPFIPLDIEDGNYLLELRSAALDVYPRVYFIDPVTSEIIATVFRQESICHLVAVQSLNILCDLEEEQLQIHSTKSIYLSGYIKLKNDFESEAEQLYIQPDRNGSSAILARDIILRIQQHLVLQENVCLQAEEGCFFSAASVSQHALLKTKHVKFAVEKFTNHGKIFASTHMMGFVLEFNNAAHGRIEAGEYFGFPAETYFGDGVIKTAVFDVQAKNITVTGHLHASESALFQAEQYLNFTQISILKVNKHLLASGRQLTALGHIEQSTGVAQFIAQDSLDILGTLCVTATNLILFSEQNLYIKQSMLGCENSKISVKAAHVILEEKLHSFQEIVINSDSGLHINHTLVATESLSIMAPSLQLDARLESQKCLLNIVGQQN